MPKSTAVDRIWLHVYRWLRRHDSPFIAKRLPICIKRKVSIDRERLVICNRTCGKFVDVRVESNFNVFRNVISKSCRLFND